MLARELIARAVYGWHGSRTLPFAIFDHISLYLPISCTLADVLFKPARWIYVLDHLSAHRAACIAQGTTRLKR